MRPTVEDYITIWKNIPYHLALENYLDCMNYFESYWLDAKCHPRNPYLNYIIAIERLWPQLVEAYELEMALDEKR